MLINPSKEWIVITPPKTGSTSITALLRSRVFGGLVYKDERWMQHNVIPHPRAVDYKKYLAIRNPWARASGLYRIQHRDKRTTPIQPFTEFCARRLIDHEGSLIYWRTLVDWCPDRAGVIRMENWEEDLQQLEPSGPFDIPHENPGKEPWQAAYEREPESIPLVRQWAAPDLLAFGYPSRLEDVWASI